MEVATPTPADNDGDGIAGEEDFENATLDFGTSIPLVGKEDAVPTHGLININTAPWRVLAALRG
jgi:hypothetical protein